MNYQSVRAAYEVPIAAACAALSPAIPVYFDNVVTTAPQSTSSFVLVNISFGLTTEPVLTRDINHIRGSIVCRIHTPKGRGTGASQTIASAITGALQTLNATARAPGPSVHVRVGPINGPTFTAPDDFPHLLGRFDCPFVATVFT